MLSWDKILKAGKTGRTQDLQTLLAARKIFGNGSDYQPTSENDYIYDNDTIIFYTGNTKCPEIPQTLDGVQVRVIEKTAFAGQDVTAVKIPDGTEVIE